MVVIMFQKVHMVLYVIFVVTIVYHKYHGAPSCTFGLSAPQHATFPGAEECERVHACLPEHRICHEILSEPEIVRSC